MSDDKIRAMVLELVREVDYDIWKEYELDDPDDWVEPSLDRMVEIVKKHMRD